MVSSIDNPSLCQACQIWDDIESFNNSWPYRPPGKVTLDAWVTIDQLATRKECMICAIAKSAVERRLSTMSIPSSATVYISAPVPNYLFPATTDDRDTSMLSRIAQSTSTGIQVQVLMLLCIHVDFKNQKGTLNPDVPLYLSIQPQVQLMYSRNTYVPRLAANSSISSLRSCLSNLTRTQSMHLASVRPWETPVFDVALLKQWLSGCAKLHGEECRKNLKATPNDLPEGFRVINLKTMNVEQPTSSQGFVALSYMWPQEKEAERSQLHKKNLELLKQPGGLTQVSMPPVISDAMRLCQMLDETYIWVDRFCIIQDDEASKHGQVSNMHQIFRCASFTIVAALNDKNPPGLPGFGTRSRMSSVNKPRVDFNAGTLVANKGFELVDKSLWNTRGWTFQERLLSTRRLYITDHEVQYECCMGHASDVFAHATPNKRKIGPFSYQKTAPINNLPGFSTWTKYSSSTNSYITGQSTILDYMNWVSDYTERDLSYGSDILSAFAGVEGSLKDAFDTSFHYGIPEKYLHIALLWMPRINNVQKRTGLSIPTWSWASITKGSNYDWLSIKSSASLRVVTLVYFHCQSPESGLRKLNVQEWWVDEELPVEDFQQQGDAPSSPQNDRSTPRWKHEKTWRECPHNPWATLQHQALDTEACRVAANLPGCLIFNTTVATVKLRKCPDEPSNDSIELCSVDTDVEILHSGYQHLGHLYSVPTQWLDYIGKSRDGLDIIVISGTFVSYETEFRMGLRQVWSEERKRLVRDRDMWQLRVMLIERDSSHPQVARRVAVGYVRAHLWKFCEPRWETVVLC